MRMPWTMFNYILATAIAMTSAVLTGRGPYGQSRHARRVQLGRHHSS